VPEIPAAKKPLLKAQLLTCGRGADAWATSVQYVLFGRSATPVRLLPLVTVLVARAQYADPVAETSYARCGALKLAYQVFGDGPIELVLIPPYVSHVELFWTLPEYKAFFHRLGTFCRVVVFDKAGVGLSDPVPKVRSVDDRAGEIEAVMDAVGFGKAALLALSEGGPAAIVWAARRPERTRALILHGTYAYLGGLEWDDLDRSPAEARARIVGELGEDYAPSTQQIVRWQEFGDAVRSDWGDGRAVKCLVPSVRSIRQLGMMERMCASPGMARATVEASFGIDVRPILPTLSIPTLVVHARGDPGVPVQYGRYLAENISGAKILEVEGVDHAPWFTEPERTTTAIEEFLTGSHAAPPRSRHALRTVLFTNIAAATQHTAAAPEPRRALHQFDETVSALTQQLGGTPVRSTCEDHFAVFDGPTQAIRCAEALRDDAETMGIRLCSAIHTGECELLDGDVAGIAVHVAARILEQAGAGEILVSRTVRDLVIGSGTGFDDRGSVELRGVPGTWQLLAVDRRGARAGTAEAALASMPTPGPRIVMRRSDRVVEIVARRTPWLLRGVAHLAHGVERN
jgi:pimeloyl-ACP methyl ester carboxylesterase